MSPTLQIPSVPIDRSDGWDVERDTPSIRTDAVYVIYTSIDETLVAVRVAGDFAKTLGVPVYARPFSGGSFRVAGGRAMRECLRSKPTRSSAGFELKSSTSASVSACAETRCRSLRWRSTRIR